MRLYTLEAVSVTQLLERMSTNFSQEAESTGATARVAETEKGPKNHQQPDISYIEMIARAILDSPLRRLCLQELYQSIERNYPCFPKAHRGWRNSVRHNLSLLECFYKGERCESGKGHYWRIHPAHLDDFLRGDFRRRLVKARARHMQSTNIRYHPYASAPQLGGHAYHSYMPLQFTMPTYATALPHQSYATSMSLPCTAAFYPTMASSSVPYSTIANFPFPSTTVPPLHIPPVSTGDYFPLDYRPTPRANTSAMAGQVESTQVAARTPPEVEFIVDNILSTQ